MTGVTYDVPDWEDCERLSYPDNQIIAMTFTRDFDVEDDVIEIARTLRRYRANEYYVDISRLSIDARVNMMVFLLAAIPHSVTRLVTAVDGSKLTLKQLGGFPNLDHAVVYADYPYKGEGDDIPRVHELQLHPRLLTQRLLDKLTTIPDLTLGMADAPVNLDTLTVVLPKMREGVTIHMAESRNVIKELLESNPTAELIVHSKTSVVQVRGDKKSVLLEGDAVEIKCHKLAERHAGFWPHPSKKQRLDY